MHARGNPHDPVTTLQEQGEDHSLYCPETTRDGVERLIGQACFTQRNSITQSITAEEFAKSLAPGREQGDRERCWARSDEK